MKKQPSPWAKYSDAPFYEEYFEGSMFGLLKRAADQWPDYTALEFVGNKTKYRDLIQNIETCAKAFVKAGIKKGDYITIISINTPMAVTAIYAANRIGAICNMLHPSLSQEEIKKFIEDVDSKAIVTFDQIYPKFKKYEWKEGMNPLFVITPIGDGLSAFKAFFYNMKNKVKIEPNPNHRLVMWKDFMADTAGVVLPEDDGKMDDPAVIMYSGGSTGVPKGCVTTNLAMNALSYSCYDVYSGKRIEGMHSLALMPCFHAFGLGISIHAMLGMGCHVFLVPSYEMEGTTKLIFKRKISFIYGVPALFHAISRSEEIEKADLSFMKHLVVAGDRVPIGLINRMNNYLEKGGSDARLLEAYGQTEGNAGSCINTFFNYKVGSFGIPFPDVEVKLCKLGTQEEVAVGETGEICVHGYTVMKEYLNNPEETKRALQTHADGKVWLHSSDLAHQDEEGYFYFDGRASRLIITSGYNVYPQEVERVIDELPFVAKSCVIGVQDPVIGEKVRGYVVLNSEEEAEEVFKQRIIEHIKENVFEYAVPQELLVVSDLPETSLGKVDAKKVMEEANQ